MKTIAVSEFKATCLSMIKTMARTKQPFAISVHGKTVAQVIPAPSAKRPKFGAMIDSGELIEDIVHDDADGEWQAQ